jgi:hypothetical protein
MLLTLDSAVTDRLRAAQEDYHRSRVIGQHDMTLLYQELWHQFDEVERARGHRFLTRQRPVTPVTRFEYLEPLRLAQNEELIDEQGIRALLNFSAPAPSPTADPWNNGVSQSAVGPTSSPVEEYVEEDTVTPSQGIVYYSEGAADADWSDYDDVTEDEDDESEGTSAEYTDDEDGSSEGWDNDNEDEDEETFVEQPDDLYEEDEEAPAPQSQGIASVYDDPDAIDDDSDEDEGDDEGTEDWYDDPEEDESYLEEPEAVSQPAPLPEVKQSQVTTSAYEVPTNLRDFIKEYPGCSMQDALKYFSARDVNKQIRLGRVVNRQGRLYL